MKQVAILLILAALTLGCNSNPGHIILTPSPDYQATIDVALAEKAACGEGWYQTMGALNDCLLRPTQTPHVIVVTPVPPTPTPVALVSCVDAPLGTKVQITTRTTVRYWHSDASNNLGQADVGAIGQLIDKSMDDDALWWWRLVSIETNDYPYGTKDGDPLKGWVKAIYSGCVPPKPQ